MHSYFHRKHASGLQPQKGHCQGRSRNGDRNGNADFKDSRNEYNETLYETLEYNRCHPKKYPPAIVSNSLIKEKENVLLESLHAFKSHASYDNKTRLGPNKENTFQNLKRSRSTSSVELVAAVPSSPTSLTLLPDSCDNRLKEKSKSICLPQNYDDRRLHTVISEFDGKQSENTQPLEGVQDQKPEVTSFTGSLNACQESQTENISSTDNIISNTIDTEDNSRVDCDTNVTKSESVESFPEDDGSNLESIAEKQPVEERVSCSPKLSFKKATKRYQKRPLTRLPSEEKKTDDEESEGEDKGNPETEFINLKMSTAIALKKLIIGSAIRSFTQQWMSQSFVLNTNPKFRYGFVQNKGGACGVLASVQGFLLKRLLFEPSTCASEVDPLRPSRQEVRKALVQAIAEILWRAGGSRQAIIVKSNKESHLEEKLVYRPDNLTDKLSWRKFSTETSLQAAVEDNLDEFTSPLGKGCLRLIISAVLSCGIQCVLEDMDDQSTPLIDPTGTCSLELVNLLLTGRAVSNVFDNDIQLDSCLLKGVSKRSEIGFLSVYEHFNTCQVGSNLKTPRYPIWLLNCENHFSIVFSSCKQLVSDWRAERQFHLYHYDGLLLHTEQTLLNIDTTGFFEKENTKKDDIPPLELCIMTKWKDAVITWSSK